MVSAYTGRLAAGSSAGEAGRLAWGGCNRAGQGDDRHHRGILLVRRQNQSLEQNQDLEPGTAAAIAKTIALCWAISSFFNPVRTFIRPVVCKPARSRVSASAGLNRRR